MDKEVGIYVSGKRKWALPFMLAEGCRRAGIEGLGEKYWAEPLHSYPPRAFKTSCRLGVVKVSFDEDEVELSFSFERKQAPLVLQVLSGLCNAQGVEIDVARAIQEVCAIILNG